MGYNYYIYASSLYPFKINTSMSRLTEIANQKLVYFNYSPRTIKTYLNYIDRFINAVNKPHDKLNSSDFQSYLDNYCFTSVSQQNQIINSIKFLYEKVLDKNIRKLILLDLVLKSTYRK